MLLVRYLEAEPAVYVTAAVVLGLIVGSFLNVVVHRLPRMMERAWQRECHEILGHEAPAPAAERFDLVAPRSRCPQCGHAIGAHENIPVVSWLVLRGRCSECGGRISWRYPAIEILGAVAAGTAAVHFGVTPAAAGAMLLGWALIALGAIDVDTQLLPDGITLPFLWLGLAFNLGGTFVPLAASVIGAMAGYGVLWVVYHLFRLATGKEGMGFGDFKLLAMIGAWLGWQALPLVVILSAFVGAVVGIALVAVRRLGREMPMPFGPYLAAAGWIALFWGAPLTAAWLGMVGPGR